LLIAVPFVSLVTLSLGAQRDERIDSGRAVRRDPRGRPRNGCTRRPEKKLSETTAPSAEKTSLPARTMTSSTGMNPKMSACAAACARS
jgi:hypothetical protein